MTNAQMLVVAIGILVAAVFGRYWGDATCRDPTLSPRTTEQIKDIFR